MGDANHAPPAALLAVLVGATHTSASLPLQKIRLSHPALIDALTTPLPGSGEEPAQKHCRISIHHQQSAAQAKLVDSLTSPTSAEPANKLDSSQFQEIGPRKCCTCNADYHFTAGEHALYHSKGFDDKPKVCKKCRDLAKADKAEAAPAPSTSSGGWGSISSQPNAKQSWTSTGRTWPPTSAQLPNGKSA